MKKFLLLIYISMGSLSFLFGEDKVEGIHYRDSLQKVIELLPADSTRLSYLERMAYCHQYPPLDKFFAASLWEESIRQENAYYENLGAYYMATCFDKRHDPDSLSYWVDKLKEMALQRGTYDYYLEQKAALSRAQASKRKVEKAIYTAKDVLEEAIRYRSHNGEIAAYNSLACAYSVSSRRSESLEILIKAHKRFTERTKLSLRVDILSRIAGNYGNIGQDSAKMPYLQEMTEVLQEVMTKEPEAKNNWTNMAIDCQVKYIMHFLNKKNFSQVQEHIEKAKALLAPHVDPVFWLNVQLMQLQYFSQTREYDKSIALIDEVTPVILKNYVYTFGMLMSYKAMTQKDKGDIEGAITTLRYLIHTQDSLNNAFSASQLDQVKEVYHIDELLLEKQKISNTNLIRILSVLAIFFVLIFFFYIYTRSLSRKIVQSEKAAAEAAARSEANNRAKERLRTDISHDIRISLNAVVGFAELLMEVDADFDKESKVEYGKIIQENAEQLLDYVNNILELSRLESGKIKYQQENCDLMEMCREAIDRARQFEKNIVQPFLQTTIQEISITTDRRNFLALLRSLIIFKKESNTDIYRTIIHIEQHEAEKKLVFRVINTPLAKDFQGNRTTLVRNEINSHLIHYFGGTYEVYPNDSEAPTLIFTYPLS